MVRAIAGAFLASLFLLSSGGCMTPRTAGQEAAGGAFDAAEKWWAEKRSGLVAEAKLAAAEAVTTHAAPVIDAKVQAAAAVVEAKIDSTIGPRVKEFVLPLAEAAAHRYTDAKVEELVAKGADPTKVTTAGGVTSEATRLYAEGKITLSDLLLYVGAGLASYFLGSLGKGAYRAATTKSGGQG